MRPQQAAGIWSCLVPPCCRSSLPCRAEQVHSVDADAPQPERSLSRAWPAPTEGVAHSHGGRSVHWGIDKGPSPCWYALRATRRGPPAREAGMARSYSSWRIDEHRVRCGVLASRPRCATHQAARPTRRPHCPADVAPRHARTSSYALVRIAFGGALTAQSHRGCRPRRTPVLRA